MVCPFTPSPLWLRIPLRSAEEMKWKKKDLLKISWCSLALPQVLDKHDATADIRTHEVSYGFFRHCHPLPSLTPPLAWMMHFRGDVPCHVPASPHPALSGKHTDVFCWTHLVPAGEGVGVITQAWLSFPPPIKPRKRRALLPHITSALCPCSFCKLLPSLSPQTSPGGVCRDGGKRGLIISSIPSDDPSDAGSPILGLPWRCVWVPSLISRTTYRPSSSAPRTDF